MPTTFKKSQQVVYPTYGIGRITEIQERDFNGKPTLYYIIHIETNDMTVMIPVDKVDERRIRAIIPPEKALEALKLMGEEAEVVPKDWKMRYEMNRQHLINGAITSVARVVQTLYYRSKVKELPILERKLYDSASKLFMNELSISLEKTLLEIEELVFERLESEKETVLSTTATDLPEVDDFDAGVDEDDLEINKEG